MINIAEKEKQLFLCHKDILRYAEKHFNNEQIISDLAMWAEAYPCNEKEKTMFWLAAVFMNKHISISHHQAALSLKRTLKGINPLQEAYASFTEEPLKPIKYEINHKNGWHSIKSPCNDSRGSDGIYMLDKDLFVERDWEYCCEQCNGKRIPFENEVDTTGFYIGWIAYGFFLALAPIEEWAYHSLNFHNSELPLEKLSLKVAFSPWNL